MKKNTLYKIMLLVIAGSSENVFNKTDPRILTCTLAKVSSISFLGWFYVLLFVFCLAILGYAIERRLFLQSINASPDKNLTNAAMMPLEYCRKNFNKEVYTSTENIKLLSLTKDFRCPEINFQAFLL